MKKNFFIVLFRRHNLKHFSEVIHRFVATKNPLFGVHRAHPSSRNPRMILEVELWIRINFVSMPNWTFFDEQSRQALKKKSNINLCTFLVNLGSVLSTNSLGLWVLTVNVNKASIVLCFFFTCSRNETKKLLCSKLWKKLFLIWRYTPLFGLLDIKCID